MRAVTAPRASTPAQAGRAPAALLMEVRQQAPAQAPDRFILPSARPRTRAQSITTAMPLVRGNSAAAAVGVIRMREGTLGIRGGGKNAPAQAGATRLTTTEDPA